MSKITTRMTVAAFFSLLALGALTGCEKKTPAEKLGDKIENAGDEVEDKIDENN